ncbi:hypothetical protein [Hungatella effluvii]|uniref:hypothetical protein n=1 Tax=Hungatella effluvii TaxID=1096246 RepID=UPI0022E57BE2|nr:hypothetical protein [Hungatella effluvii]
MDEVNIEQIMNEIRNEIQNNGFEDNCPAFDDIAVHKFNVGIWDLDEFEDSVLQVNENQYIDPEWKIPSKGIKKIIKLVIRKIVNTYTRPIVDDQNLYNRNLQSSINMIYSYIVENEKYKKRQQRMMEHMEEENLVLKRQLSELQNRKEHGAE